MRKTVRLRLKINISYDIYKNQTVWYQRAGCKEHGHYVLLVSLSPNPIYSISSCTAVTGGVKTHLPSSLAVKVLLWHSFYEQMTQKLKVQQEPSSCSCGVRQSNFNSCISGSWASVTVSTHQDCKCEEQWWE